MESVTHIPNFRVISENVTHVTFRKFLRRDDDDASPFIKRRPVCKHPLGHLPDNLQPWPARIRAVQRVHAYKYLNKRLSLESIQTPIVETESIGHLK